MIRFILKLLTPILFLFAVMVYLGDFRMVSVGFAVAGCVTYLISEELARE